MCSSHQPLNGADSATRTVPLGPCVICGVELVDQDEPTPVYEINDSEIQAGWIHGASDCSATI